MEAGTVYRWKLFQKSLAFKWPRSRKQSRLNDLRISFGFWVRFTHDNIVEEQRRRTQPKGTQGLDASNITIPRFSYSSLPQGPQPSFRLFRLLPGTSDEPLCGSLETHLVEEAPPYQALSYVWGVSTPYSYLIIEGHSLPITQNLTDALKSLRNQEGEILIWIDSVCINQADNEEKGHQVAIMSTIYHTAAQVVVWLGAERYRSVDDLQALRYFVDCSAVDIEAPWYGPRTRDGGKDSIVSQEMVKGLQDILQRPWWSRIWTVQEAVLAQQVKLVCGASAVSWQTDVDTLRIIRYKIKSGAISNKWRSTDLRFINLGPLLEVVEAQLRERAADGLCHLEKDLLDVAYEFRHRLSSDPRDRIYAIMGLAEGRELLGIRPDYSLSIEEVEEEFGRSIQALYPGVQVQAGI